MKNVFSLGLLFAAVGAAQGATTVGTDTLGNWTLKRGNTTVATGAGTWPECKARAQQDAETRALTANYACTQTDSFAVTYSAPTPPPPPPAPPPPAPAPGTWTKIADEGQTFAVSGTQTVRYGAGTSWVQMNVTTSGQCTNAFFGSDPIYGTVKECDLLNASAPPPPAPAPAPAPVPGASYSTTFPIAESIISQGGYWTNGRVVGIDWNDVSTSVGEAFGSTTVDGYNDDVAVLNSGFTSNQFSEGVVYHATGYSPAVSHEVELLLHFQITAHNARGYEVLWGANGEVNIVRWNGPLGNYTPLLTSTGPNIGSAVDGDVLRAEIVSNVIRVYKNGALVLTGPTDTTFIDGQPGLGFWPKTGATPSSYGWKSFTAGSL